MQVQEKLDKFQQRRLHEFFVPGGGSSKGEKVADLEVRLLCAVKSQSAADQENLCQTAACMSAHSFGASCYSQQASFSQQDPDCMRRLQRWQSGSGSCALRVPGHLQDFGVARPPSARGRNARATSVQLPDEVQQENVGDTSNMLESQEPSEPLGLAPDRCFLADIRPSCDANKRLISHVEPAWQSRLMGPQTSCLH